MDELTLTNRAGHTVVLNPLGAAMTAILVPDRTGHIASVTLDAGGSAGKVIGRYANRIAGGTFVLDGATMTLATNEGRNTLHGGPDGFSKRVWTIAERSVASAVFTLHSPDGDQGFPGALDVRVRYGWSDDDAIRIDYEATTDAPTVVNLTNHVYFNLTGDPSRSIAEHLLRIAASHYTVVDAESIPTGEIAALDAAGDFRTERPVGTEKFDRTLVFDDWDGTLRHVATLTDPSSGRTMTLETTEPGAQLFTGKSGAIALETQHFADSPNHPNFPTTILRPGETFTSTTIYRFAVAP